MNQIADAPRSHRSVALRLVQAFGFVVAALGICFALAGTANLVLDQGWPMTWIIIPIGVAIALLGLTLGWLAQRIWDVVYYFASL
jgi:hypothetical protein